MTKSRLGATDEVTRRGPDLARQGTETSARDQEPWIGSLGLVALCAVFTLALRVPFLTRPLVPDEAGLLQIAHHWSEGPFLYGDFFIGRGVLVLGFFRAGDALGGAVGVRLLASLLAVVMVLLAGWVGHRLGGRTGAGWCALVAASYSSTYAFGAEGMNERLLAATLVLASCTLTLEAVRRPQAPVPAVLAGVLGALPLLVIQSFFDGLLFAVVLLVCLVQGRMIGWRDAARVAVGGLVGVALTLAGLALLIGTTWMTWSQLWFQTVSYRVEASRVVDDGTGMPVDRMEVLAIVAGVTGVWLLLLGFLGGWATIRRRRDLRAIWIAVLAMIGLSLASMRAGGDYWSDYLLQLVPGLVIATALLVPRVSWSGVVLRTGTVLAMVAAVVAVYMGREVPRLGTPDNEAAVGKWIAAAAENSDSAVVLFGKANVLQSAGLETPYPYMWSLLTRTLDPELTELLGVLRGPDAPTWVVEWHDLDSWGLDSRGLLAATLADRYVAAGAPCGVEVLVLRTEARDVLPETRCTELE